MLIMKPQTSCFRYNRYSLYILSSSIAVLVLCFWKRGIGRTNSPAPLSLHIYWQLKLLIKSLLTPKFFIVRMAQIIHNNPDLIFVTFGNFEIT